MSHRVEPGAGRAFTMVEVLVVLGLTAIMLSLVLPTLGDARSSALHSKTSANIRQMAVGLQMYANGNRELPPVFGKAAWPAQAPWHFDFGDVGRGNWFEHSAFYSYAVLELLGDQRVARAAGNPDPEALVVHNGVTVSRSDFVLTNTLYATPAFFNWSSQLGPVQFVPQQMSSIAHPSNKGLLWTYEMFSYPKYGRVMSCCTVDLPSPIAFADLSVSDHIMRRMPPGIVNLYGSDGLVATADPRRVPGTPVANTVDGILGRDR